MDCQNIQEQQATGDDEDFLDEILEEERARKGAEDERPTKKKAKKKGKRGKKGKKKTN